MKQTKNSPTTDRHLPHPNIILTCRDVALAMWQICCRIVVSSSVGGVVQHVRSRCLCSGVWAIYRMTARCCTTNLIGNGHVVKYALLDLILKDFLYKSLVVVYAWRAAVKRRLARDHFCRVFMIRLMYLHTCMLYTSGLVGLLCCLATKNTAVKEQYTCFQRILIVSLSLQVCGRE